MKARTKKFALRIIKMSSSLPRTREANVVANQILRSAASVGENYRAACRARSTADFISKITIVEEEADETLYWLEIIDESKMLKHERLISLMKEADELVAIFTASGRTAKINNRKQSRKR